MFIQAHTCIYDMYSIHVCMCVCVCVCVCMCVMCIRYGRLGHADTGARTTPTLVACTFFKNERVRVLQSVAGCCTVLQGVAGTHLPSLTGSSCTKLECMFVLQDVAGCCRVVQGVAGWCRAVQGGAGWCRVV